MRTALKVFGLTLQGAIIFIMIAVIVIILSIPKTIFFYLYKPLHFITNGLIRLWFAYMDYYRENIKQ